MSDQAFEGLPISVDIHQKNGLGVQSELPPCQNLEKFVQRSRAAGQHHNRVRVHEHDLLALVHRLGDHMAGQVCLEGLPAHQMLGDHPECRAARLLRRPRGAPHQAHIPRAIYQPPSRRRQTRAHRIGSLAIRGTHPLPCAAKDTD